MLYPFVRRYTVPALLLTIWFTIISPTVSGQTFNPRYYWNFDDPAQPMKDQMGQFDLDPNFYGSPYTVNSGTPGQGVGDHLTLDASSDLFRAGSLPIDSAFTIEFQFRPGYGFKETRFFYRLDDAITIRMSYPYILFQTRIQTPAGSEYDDLRVELDALGRRSYGYYIDGDWHHIVFRYNSNTGQKSIWVDGQVAPGFSKTTSTGYFPNSSGVNRDMVLNTNISYQKYGGDYDEIAIYGYELPDRMIYRHYLDFQSGQHYSFVNANLTVPGPDPVTGPIDPDDFAPGHPAINVNALEQLSTFPVPRYVPGHTLLPNFNWIDPVYMSGRFQPGVGDALSVSTSVEMQRVLASDFNYMLQVSNNNNQWNDAWIFLANQNPQWKLSMITFRLQLPNDRISSQSLPNDHYLQNSSGQFLDLNGNVTSNKIWRPSAPVGSYQDDGKDMLNYINANLAGKLSRPIDFVNENGEAFPLISNTALAKDPQVTAGKNASGLGWEEYLANRYKEHSTVPYRDIIMNSSAFAPGTIYSEYRIDGHRDWQFRYSQSRLINTPINGQRYSTTDFYVRWPKNWRWWQGPWHGWQWIVESRINELAQGDKLFSPFVAAGWDEDSEKNVRPAQWLGLLKSLSMLGAEFFYTGYFNENGSYMPPNPPPHDPDGYIWQAVMPSYAQGVASRYEQFYRNGDLLEGDVPISPYDPASDMALNFWTGDPRQIVTVRKEQNQPRYAISGTLQPNSNMTGAAEKERISTIILNGDPVTFNVRRQGSTYIYDNSQASAPVFYQLDGWHESTHPSLWSTDFILEAELFDNQPSSVDIKTSVPPGTPVGDFSEFTSYLSFRAVAPVQYHFQPKGAARDYYFWVRARSTDGTSTGINITMNGSNQKTIDCITDTSWNWYRFDKNNAVITYPSVTLQDQLLQIIPLNTKIEIDVISLVNASGPVYGSIPPPCNNGATISASGPTTFCQGQQVILTSSTGASYQWSTGATSQSINVTSSGTYTVTVDGTDVATPVQVTVHPLPQAGVTASGPTTFCQGEDVTLTAGNGTAYLWTPGNQTTAALTVSTAGSYSVRVTNQYGCSKVSQPVSVTVQPLPSTAVNANGPTTFCDGEQVTLSAPPGGAYVWLPGNQTSQSINVYTQGSYQVMVTGSNGCSATSSATQVTVLPLPPANVTASGPLSFAYGDSVVLTANPVASYYWFPGGETTQSITVFTTGTYGVLVTGTNGCTQYSQATSVFVSSTSTPAIVPSGPTTFCQGNNVVLTAPAGISFLWSNGATTQSITVTSSGQYLVTVQTPTSSFTTAPETVTVHPLPTAQISASGPTAFCPGGHVILQAAVASSYLWSPGGETTQSITVSSTGSYSVQTTNVQGCTDVSATLGVTVSPTPAATITPGGSTSICPGDNVTLQASAAAAYLWSPGGETTQSVAVAAAGSYSVQTTNAQGCTASSAVVSVSVSALPVAAITPGGNTSFCDGETVLLQAGAASSYLWLPGGQTTASISVATAGSYSVQVSNASGCTATSPSVPVLVYPSPNVIVSANGPVAFCDGGNVNLQAFGGSVYQWSPGGQTTAGIVVYSGGAYSVQVTNSDGCSAISGVTTVKVYPLPTATVTPGGSTTLCHGAGVNLNASPGTSYIWTPGGQTTASIYTTTSGSYSVQVMNQYGCASASAPVAVTTQGNCPCDPPQGLYESNLTASGAVLNWTPAAGADSMQILLFRVFPSPRMKIIDGIGGAQTSMAISVFPSAWYMWRMRSYCGGSRSAWSSLNWFYTPFVKTTGPGRQDIPVLPQPVRTASQGPDHMLVYPNPAHDRVTIRFTAPVNGHAFWLLKDGRGKVIRQSDIIVNEGVNILETEIAEVVPGLYFIEIANDRMQHLGKVVIH